MADRLKTPLAQRLGLDVPMFLAPMAGATSPALAAAVAGAGALGAFGCAFTEPDAMKRDAATVRGLTDRPFQLNFFAAPQPDPVPPQAQRSAMAVLEGYYRELGLPAPAPA